MLEFICYSRCSTCKKAQKLLDAQGTAYRLRDIKENKPTLEELTRWHAMSGLPLKKLFNTSGQLYKSMQLKDKLGSMTDAEQLALLATDGMLVKRPLLISSEGIIIGFDVEKYQAVGDKK